MPFDELASDLKQRWLGETKALIIPALMDDLNLSRSRPEIIHAFFHQGPC